MQRFDYRSPRYPVDLPVRLTAENSTRVGRCRDISREGHEAGVVPAASADACGTVSMTFQNQTLELNVRVAHAGATQDGMKFILYIRQRAERCGASRRIPDSSHERRR